MSIIAARERLRASRDRARDWLLQRVGSGGAPAAHQDGNGWSRFPWTLALLGETEAASAVLEWAARNGLADNGDLSAGSTYGQGRYGAYPIGHLAMGAVLLERHDIAARLFSRLEELQDKTTGGMPIDPPQGEFNGLCELLSTAQVGIAAVLAGRMAMAKRLRDWTVACLREQPRLPQVLYTARSADGLVIDPPAALRWGLEVQFDKPRQAYFYPGIAAAFLAVYATKAGDQEALAAGHDFLAINLAGSQEQFDDLASVQACKFAWGAALMQMADPRCDYADSLARMADWFIVRQRADGSWAPSTFVSAEPSTVELMTKTAEHAMEVTAVLAALAVLEARGAGAAS